MQSVPDVRTGRSNPASCCWRRCTTLTKVIEEEHFRTVESEVYRVLALINVEITVCTCTCPPPPLFGHSE